MLLFPLSGPGKFLPDIWGVHDPSVQGRPHRDGAILHRRELCLREGSRERRGAVDWNWFIWSRIWFLTQKLNDHICSIGIFNFLKLFLSLASSQSSHFNRACCTVADLFWSRCVFGRPGWGTPPAPVPARFGEAPEPLSNGHDWSRHWQTFVLPLCGLQILRSGVALP